MDYQLKAPAPGSVNIGVAIREDPRAVMAARLPRMVQPLLTWLTARPAPGEQAAAGRGAIAYVWGALALVGGGVLLSAAAAFLLLHGRSIDGGGPESQAESFAGGLALLPVLAAGLLLTTSGLGLFQVVVFHHCGHGTVFKTPTRNRDVGRLVSALLLFKHFDHYQKEHMLHHSANKLFTDDDEFTDFVVGICKMAPSMSRKQLWRQLLTSLVSPLFHGRFLYKRLLGSLNSHDRLHNAVGLGFLCVLMAGGALTHSLAIVMIAWGPAAHPAAADRHGVSHSVRTSNAPRAGACRARQGVGLSGDGWGISRRRAAAGACHDGRRPRRLESVVGEYADGAVACPDVRAGGRRAMP